MKKTIIAATVVALTATTAFAGGKNQVIIESEVDQPDPFVPVAGSSANLGPVAVAAGALLLIAAIAASSGTD